MSSKKDWTECLDCSKGVHGIADDILTHGTMEIEHDGRLITLLETARKNNLSLNPKKIQFKSTDFKFFGH